MKLQLISVRLLGLRPLMFDRYAGDNSTALPVAEKMYINSDQQLILPAVNVYSLLCAENTKSVCRQFFGKNGKTIGLGIASYTTIEPFDIPILRNGKPIVFDGFGQEKGLTIHRSVARLKGGVPNPKERPMLACPWEITFTIQYQENKHCTLENLRQSMAMGGTLGLGTFRPYFGRYEMAEFASVEG